MSVQRRGLLGGREGQRARIVAAEGNLVDLKALHHLECTAMPRALQAIGDALKVGDQVGLTATGPAVGADDMSLLDFRKGEGKDRARQRVPQAYGHVRAGVAHEVEGLTSCQPHMPWAARIERLSKRRSLNARCFQHAHCFGDAAAALC